MRNQLTFYHRLVLRANRWFQRLACHHPVPLACVRDKAMLGLEELELLADVGFCNRTMAQEQKTGYHVKWGSW